MTILVNKQLFFKILTYKTNFLPCYFPRFQSKFLRISFQKLIGTLKSFNCSVYFSACHILTHAYNHCKIKTNKTSLYVTLIDFYTHFKNMHFRKLGTYILLNNSWLATLFMNKNISQNFYM